MAEKVGPPTPQFVYREPEQMLMAKLQAGSPDVILFQNDHVLVVNKPPGVLSEASRGETLAGMREVVKAVFGPEAENAHRIDRDTSGLLVFGTSRKGRKELGEQFRNKTRASLKKNYLTILDGKFADDVDTLEVKVGIRGTRTVRRKVVFPGEEAPAEYPAQDSVTYFTPCVLFDAGGAEKTLTGVRIVTGRQHQIRVVAAEALGMPVVGDYLYNPGPRSAPRQMLHSWSLSFTLPGTKEMQTVEAPLPNDFRDILAGMTPVKAYVRSDTESSQTNIKAA